MTTKPQKIEGGKKDWLDWSIEWEESDKLQSQFVTSDQYVIFKLMEQLTKANRELFRLRKVCG